MLAQKAGHERWCKPADLVRRHSDATASRISTCEAVAAWMGVMIASPRQDQVPATRPRPDGGAAEPDGLMVFDGLCNFCAAQVRLILRLDRAGAIRFTSIQSPYGRHLAERFGLDPDDPSTFLFFDRGRPLEASDAVIATLRRLPRPWRWLAALRILPRPVRDAAYRLIARNRYRLLGRRDACVVPEPHLRVRFIDDIPPGGQ